MLRSGILKRRASRGLSTAAKPGGYRPAMVALENSKHEQFAQLVAKGVSASKAYVSVGYSQGGAAQGAARLLRNAKVCSHVAEIRSALAEGIIQREITNRNARVGLLQDLVERMRRVIEERGAELADVPGGSSGLLVKTYKGKDADTAVYRFDAALVEQMNATCKQVAIEIGQWTEKRNMAITGDLADRILEARRRKVQR
jgi:hypothetical protein